MDGSEMEKPPEASSMPEDHFDTEIVPPKQEIDSNVSPTIDEIDIDVAFLTDQLITSIEILVDADRSIVDQQRVPVDESKDNVDHFEPDAESSSTIDDDRQSRSDQIIHDPLIRKLIENFEPTDVPHTHANFKNGRIELRKKSSEWIRSQILCMLDSNVNPDPFVRNVEQHFGVKMMPLILEPYDFTNVLAQKLGSLEKECRPYHLMCLLTQYCDSWPTRFHEPSPVFRPKSESMGERRPTTNYTKQKHEFNRKNPAFFHDQPPKKVAEAWEKYVWNQRPPPISASAASSHMDGDRREDVFRRSYNEPVPLFPPLRFDNRAPDEFIPPSYVRSRSPVARYDDRIPPLAHYDRIPPSAHHDRIPPLVHHDMIPPPAYHGDSRPYYDDRQYFDRRYQNERDARSFQPDYYRSTDYRYGQFSSRPDYSSGYGSAWCSRDDVERNSSRRPY